MPSTQSKISSFNIQDLDKPRLKQIIAKFAQAHITVIGDLILDEFLFASPERISREAPVIIFKYSKSEQALGGAANAAHNIASLGANVNLIGITGKDASARAIGQLCDVNNINLINLQDPQSNTTTKTRIISSSNPNPNNGTNLQQQVLRIDRDSELDLRPKFEAQILQEHNKLLAQSDITLISDYGNGLITEDLAQNIIQSQPKTIIDSNSTLYKFSGAYSLTPNQPDIEKLIGKAIDSDKALETHGKKLLEQLEANNLLITRGAKGMALYTQESTNLIPALNLSEVFDVTGAGDTVSACYSLSLAVGADPLEAALIGNLAASIVVRKYGTATTNQAELLTLIDQL